jgi:hypothetical protein
MKNFESLVEQDLRAAYGEKHILQQCKALTHWALCGVQG